jgi:hypothetical protein
VAISVKQAGSGRFFPASVSTGEIIVWLVGMLVSYGSSGMAGLFSAILAVGGDGSAAGVMLVGGFMLVCIIASFVLSIVLARRGSLVLSILAGFIPIGVLGATVFILDLVL